jgi:ParB family chromosome partitioning protein
LISEVLRSIPEQEVTSILPNTIAALKGIASLNQETMANYLQNWERARAARLRNLLFKLTDEQLQTVESAINSILPEARRHQGISPNTRGTALFLICKSYMKERKDDK